MIKFVTNVWRMIFHLEIIRVQDFRFPRVLSNGEKENRVQLSYLILKEPCSYIKSWNKLILEIAELIGQIPNFTNSMREWRNLYNYDIKNTQKPKSPNGGWFSFNFHLNGFVIRLEDLRSCPFAKSRRCCCNLCCNFQSNLASRVSFLFPFPIWIFAATKTKTNWKTFHRN